MIQKIAGYNVTLVSPSSAKVGCTKVTKEEVEALLEAMKEVPKFQIYDNPSFVGTEHEFKNVGVHFTMRRHKKGFIAVDTDVEHAQNFSHATASFFLNFKDAEKVLEYLANKLGKQIIPKS